MNATRPEPFDVVVAGAGIVGLSFALAVRNALGSRARVAVCDPRLDASPRGRDFRAVAIAAGSRRFLETLGVWTSLAPRAQPVAKIVLTDSRPGAQPPPVFLGFGDEAAPGEPFAHMVLHDELSSALLAGCRTAGVALRPDDVSRTAMGHEGALVGLGEASLLASLLVGADGGRSPVREWAGIKSTGWDYAQAAIVATLALEGDHGGVATQHFLPGGPLAILPMRADDGTRRRVSIVWTERQAEADRLMGLAPDAFLDELVDRAGNQYGRLRLEDEPRRLPLRVRLARSFVAPRTALIGDAAHVVHPLAGQGLNLGLRDASALAEGVVGAMRLGLDPGMPALLTAYQRARRPDAVAMAAATDGLNRLFSNDSTPLRLLRDLGLGLVDRAPELKRLLIRQAAGTRADAPRDETPDRGPWARRRPPVARPVDRA